MNKSDEVLNEFQDITFKDILKLKSISRMTLRQGHIELHNFIAMKGYSYNQGKNILNIAINFNPKKVLIGETT